MTVRNYILPPWKWRLSVGLIVSVSAWETSDGEHYRSWYKVHPVKIYLSVFVIGAILFLAGCTATPRDVCIPDLPRCGKALPAPGPDALGNS